MDPVGCTFFIPGLFFTHWRLSTCPTFLSSSAAMGHLNITLSGSIKDKKYKKHILIIF